MTDTSVFEDLKLVAAQLAGFLVLEGSGGRTDPTLLVSAERVYSTAVDRLKSSRAQEPHLLTAASKLGGALREMRTTRRDALPLLESAYEDLQAVPGVQMVTFERGCCAR